MKENILLVHVTNLSFYLNLIKMQLYKFTFKEYNILNSK